MRGEVSATANGRKFARIFGNATVPVAAGRVSRPAQTGSIETGMCSARRQTRRSSRPCSQRFGFQSICVHWRPLAVLCSTSGSFRIALCKSLIFTIISDISNDPTPRSCWTRSNAWRTNARGQPGAIGPKESGRRFPAACGKRKLRPCRSRNRI